MSCFNHVLNILDGYTQSITSLLIHLPFHDYIFKKNEMLNNANHQIRKEYQELSNEVKELKKQRDFLFIQV